MGITEGLVRSYRRFGMSREKSRLRGGCSRKAPERDENFVLLRQFNRQERLDISVDDVGFFMLQKSHGSGPKVSYKSN